MLLKPWKIQKCAIKELTLSHIQTIKIPGYVSLWYLSRIKNGSHAHKTKSWILVWVSFVISVSIPVIFIWDPPPTINLWGWLYKCILFDVHGNDSLPFWNKVRVLHGVLYLLYVHVFMYMYTAYFVCNKHSSMRHIYFVWNVTCCNINHTDNCKI